MNEVEEDVVAQELVNDEDMEDEDLVDDDAIDNDYDEDEDNFTNDDENNTDDTDVVAPAEKPKDSKVAVITREQEIDLIIQDSYERGKREGRLNALTGSTNQFTGEPIKDEIDNEVYQTMLAIDKEGGDPLTDYHKHVMKERRNLIASQAEGNKSAQAMQKDLMDFNTGYKEIGVEELFANKDFARFASGKIGNQPLINIYNDYKDYTADIDRRVAQRSKLNAAKQNSTPGALSTGKATLTKGVDDLSPAEFERMKQRAMRGEFSKRR